MTDHLLVKNLKNKTPQSVKSEGTKKKPKKSGDRKHLFTIETTVVWLFCTGFISVLPECRRVNCRRIHLKKNQVKLIKDRRALAGCQINGFIKSSPFRKTEAGWVDPVARQGPRSLQQSPRLLTGLWRESHTERERHREGKRKKERERGRDMDV